MCIVFGTEEFTSPIKQYQGITARCHNCGNYSAHCVTRWPWFTVCFVPVVPLALHKYKEVTCPICRFEQDISTRPDVQGQIAQSEGGAMMTPVPGPGGAPPAQGYASGVEPHAQGASAHGYK